MSLGKKQKIKNLPEVDNHWPRATMVHLGHHMERWYLTIKPTERRVKPRDNKAAREVSH